MHVILGFVLHKETPPLLWAEIFPPTTQWLVEEQAFCVLVLFPLSLLPSPTVCQQKSTEHFESKHLLVSFCSIKPLFQRIVSTLLTFCGFFVGHKLWIDLMPFLVSRPSRFQGSQGDTKRWRGNNQTSLWPGYRLDPRESSLVGTSCLAAWAPMQHFSHPPCFFQQSFCLAEYLSPRCAKWPHTENQEHHPFDILHFSWVWCHVEDNVTAVSSGVAMTTGYIQGVLSAVENKAPGTKSE